VGVSLLVTAIRAYRLLFCGCTSPLSCCRKGIAAAGLLPFGQAVGVVAQIYGDCAHEHPDR
jgi:hypothetical protein